MQLDLIPAPIAQPAPRSPAYDPTWTAMEREEQAKRPPVPEWLKSDRFVFHLRSHTIFEPQRRLVRRGDVFCLLDLCDRPYPLVECDRVRLEFLVHGVTNFVTQAQSIVVYPDPAGLVVSDGVRKVKILIPPGGSA